MVDAWASPEEPAAAPSDFVSTRQLSRVLLTLLGLEWLGLLLVALLEPLEAFVFAGELEAGTGTGIVLGALMALGGLGTLGFMLLALPLWIYWHHRSASNLIALGRQGMVFSPNGHALWWFAPFVNLVWPYQAVLELYRGSLPEEGEDWAMAATPSLFPVWWGCWLAGNVIQNVSTRMSLQSGMEEVAAAAGVLASPFMLVALALYLMWVKQISDNQDQLAAKRGL